MYLFEICLRTDAIDLSERLYNVGSGFRAESRKTASASIRSDCVTFRLRSVGMVIVVVFKESGDLSMQRVKSDDGFDAGIAVKVAKAKQRAAWKLAVLIGTFFCKFILVGAVITSAILSFLFNLNGPILFAGSIVGFTILALVGVPFKKLWKSELFQAYQFEKLWEYARATLSESSSGEVEDILEGKSPKSCDKLVLGQEILYWIRKGDLRKCLLLSEHLAQQSDDSPNPYGSDARSALYMELGKYHDGQALALSWLAQLEADGRSRSGAYINSLLALIDGYEALRRRTDAEKMLNRLREVVEGAAPEDMTEALLRRQTGPEIEWSFYWLCLGRLHVLKGDFENAEIDLNKARTLMSHDRNNKVLTLLYPEILLTIAELYVSRNRFVEAEQLIKETIEYYHSRTSYEGLDYMYGKALLQYVLIKQGKACSENDIEAALSWFQEQLEPLHPKTAACLVYLGEFQRVQGEVDQARVSWERSLKMRQELFGKTDALVGEVEELLSSLVLSEPAVA